MLAISRPATPIATPPSGSAIAPQDIGTSPPAPALHHLAPMPAALAGLPAALAGLPAHLRRPHTSRGAPPVISAFAAGSLGALSSVTLVGTGALANIAAGTGEDGRPAIGPLVATAVVGVLSVGAAAVSINEGIKNFRHRHAGHRNGTPMMSPTNNDAPEIV